MNELKFEQMMRFTEYLSHTKISESEFLNLLIDGKINLYAFVQKAELFDVFYDSQRKRSIKPV